MKFRFLGIPYAITSAVLSAPAVFAASQSNVVIPTTGVPTNVGGLYSFLCSASNWFFAFIIILAVFFLLLAAYKFFGAGGDQDAISTARKYVIYALVGVAVAILAKALVFVIGDFLGNTTSLFDLGLGC